MLFVKLLQLCLTLCNPMDRSLLGFSVHGDSPGKNTEVGCHALLQGTFPTQESSMNILRLLHWQAASSPLMPPGDRSSVQFSRSVMSDSLQPHESKHARPPCPPSQSLHKLMPIESVMPSSHLILCRPLLLLPPTPPSIRAFSNESTLPMRWPKYWTFSFSTHLQ